MVECRTSDPEVPSSKPAVGKKKICQRSNQYITTTNSSAPELNLPEIDRREKPEVTAVQWLECRTRDPAVPSSNPSVGKKKICHRSNQNNTTINPSPPELITWYCQRWKPKVGMLQWWSPGLDIQRFPGQTLERAKRKSLTGPIRTIPPPISLHESWIPDIVWGETQKLQWCSGRVQD